MTRSAVSFVRFEEYQRCNKIDASMYSVRWSWTKEEMSCLEWFHSMIVRRGIDLDDHNVVRFRTRLVIGFHRLGINKHVYYVVVQNPQGSPMQRSHSAFGVFSRKKPTIQFPNTGTTAGVELCGRQESNPLVSSWRQHLMRNILLFISSIASGIQFWNLVVVVVLVDDDASDHADPHSI